MGGDSTNPIGYGYFNGSGNTQFAVSVGGSWWTGIGQLGLLAWNSENTLAGSISDGGSLWSLVNKLTFSDLKLIRLKEVYLK